MSDGVLTGPATELVAGSVTLDKLDAATRDLRIRLVGMVELAAEEWRGRRPERVPELIVVDGEEQEVLPAPDLADSQALVIELWQVARLFDRLAADCKAAADQARAEAGVEAELIGRKDRAQRTLLVVPVDDEGAVLKVRPKTRDVKNVDTEGLRTVLGALATSRTSSWAYEGCPGTGGADGCNLNAEGVCRECGQDAARVLYDTGRVDGAVFAHDELARLARFEWRSSAFKTLGKVFADAGLDELAAMAEKIIESVKVETDGWTVDHDTGQRRT